jgi:hypothetical protein
VQSDGCAIRLRNARVLVSVVVLGLVTGSARGQGSSSPAGVRHSLSGAWTLNAALSDPVDADDAAETSLVLTMGRQAVTFYERDGSRQIYGLSGRRERRDLGSGTVWTTATWDGTTLRLVFEGTRSPRILQLFSVDEHTGKLIVVTSPDPDYQRKNMLRLVYDPLVDRTR